MGALCDATECVDDLSIDFTGIRLASNGVAFGEANLFGNELFEPPHLRVIAVKEFEEAGLCTRRALSAASLNQADAVFEIL